nr:putative ribonuclease H-like domain-containing protein [Tanacetum cinerariifolium]
IKSSNDNGSKPSSDDIKKVDEDPIKVNERNDQEKEDNGNNNNNVNTVSSTVNDAKTNEDNELPFDPKIPVLEDIKEEVYVCQPPGFEDPDIPDRVYKVEKALCRLHQALKAWYLKGQPKIGLWYPKDSLFDLVAYTDSDYVGASLDIKSTKGGCQSLRCRLISWQCKQQTVVENSTTKAEYDASKQGRRIDAIDADDEITLVNNADNEIFYVDDLGGEEVFVKKQNDNVVKEVVNAAQNMEGFKLNDLKLKEFDRIQEIFNRAFRRVNTFEEFRPELVEGKEKRAGTELEQEVTNKQKLERLYKVGLPARVESSRDEESLGEDASKQGRRIDADDEITLVNNADNEIFDVDDLGGEDVFVKKQNDNVGEEVVNAAQIVMENPNHLNESNEAIPKVNPVFHEPNQVTDIHDPNEMLDIPDDIDLVDYDEEDLEEEPKKNPRKMLILSLRMMLS